MAKEDRVLEWKQSTSPAMSETAVILFCNHTYYISARVHATAYDAFPVLEEVKVADVMQMS